MSVVRPGTALDLEACAEMAGGDLAKRRFAQAISAPEQLFLVAEWAGAPVGFLIATPDVRAGTVRTDEFHVESPGLWPSVGQHLLREARMCLKARGAARIIVRDGDAALLKSEGFSRVPEGWAADV
jgi:hypothetical protein